MTIEDALRQKSFRNEYQIAILDDLVSKISVNEAAELNRLLDKLRNCWL